MSKDEHNMIVAFFSNIVNHHTLPLIDELNSIEGVSAFFVETEQLPDFLKNGGYREYGDDDKIIHTWRSKAEWDKAMDLAVSADVMMIGSAPDSFLKERLNKGLLTFKCSERPLKNGLIKDFPLIPIYKYKYLKYYRNKPVYLLCYSAFAAKDYYLMNTFKGKCFRFAYLPRIKEQSIKNVLSEKRRVKKLKLLWCARFLNWKHPELPVVLAQRLMSAGYDFEINMIGSGEEFERIKTLICQFKVEGYVHLLGNFPNEEVLNIMKEHHIFLFTSDQREGWGVVLNEAMGQLCCPVTSNLIGATPYLVNHMHNGLVFKSGDIDSLYRNVKYLLDNQEEIYRLAENAYQSIRETWNPKYVAKRFLRLCDSLLRGELTPFSEGPCSLSSPKDSIVVYR